MSNPNKIRVPILFFLLVFLSGCETNRRIDFKSGWSTSDEYWMSYTSIDGEADADLYIRLVVDSDYGYPNFAFAFEASSPEGVYVTDTLSFKLDTTVRTNYKGEYVNDRVVISDMSLKKGRYNFKVKQIMSDTLFGVKKCVLNVIPKKDDL